MGASVLRFLCTRISERRANARENEWIIAAPVGPRAAPHAGDGNTSAPTATRRHGQSPDAHGEAALAFPEHAITACPLDPFTLPPSKPTSSGPSASVVTPGTCELTKLEERAGQPLFVCSKQGVCATPADNRLLDR